jgi:Family of unknown function (DUF5819)
MSLMQDAPPRADAAPPPPESPRPSMRLRLGTLVALVPVVVYVVACLIYNAPASAAQDRLKGGAATLMEPYFWQDWQLFGPTPGSNNDLVYLTTRIRRPSGDVVETKPVEVEQAIDRMPRSFPLNPTKLPGIFLAMDATSVRYSQAASRLKKLPADRQAAAQRELDKTFASNFLELQRFMSARAASLYPDQDILAVRVTFAHRPIVPFSQRYVRPHPPTSSKTMLVTSWMPFVPGVER